MQPEEILRFWGSHNLRRWSRDNLEDVAIPEAAKAFLIDVGMPIREDWTFRFDSQADRLPRLPQNSKYRRIGFDDVVPLCVDEARSGVVVAVETPVGGTERYVNRDVLSLGSCLVHYQQYRAAASVTSETEIEPIVAVTSRLMRVADPSAFDDPDAWWPVIIQQMRDGLL